MTKLSSGNPSIGRPVQIAVGCILMCISALLIFFAASREKFVLGDLQFICLTGFMGLLFFSGLFGSGSMCDEVWEDQDILWFKKGDKVVTIEFKDVKWSDFNNGRNPVVKMWLHHETKLGKELSFTPLTYWHPLHPSKGHPTIENLIVRIKQARQK